LNLRGWSALLLAVAVLLSAVAVVVVKQESRTRFVKLQALERARDALDVEWGQLQLEQSTWATHGRIESVARKRLRMELPAPEAIVLVTP
jgi:cell division protein FtsL